MKRRHYAITLLLMGLAACDPGLDPAAPERPAVPRRAEAPITSTTYFALTPLPGVLVATGLNEDATVAGHRYSDPSTWVGDFRWSAGDASETPIPFETPPVIVPAHVDAAGRVVGTRACSVGAFVYCGYQWTETGGDREFYPLAGHESSAAEDLSPSGAVVVGRSNKFFGTIASATRWDAATGDAQYVGPPGDEGIRFNRALAVNDVGTIVGDAVLESPGGGDRVPFQWTPGAGYAVLTALQDAVATAAPGVEVLDILPLAINAHGEIVGFWTELNAVPRRRHGFFWSPTSGFVDFRGQSGSGQVAAIDLNDDSQVAFAIVTAGAGGDVYEPWVWSAEGGFVRLPELTTGRTSIAAINNRGQVTGTDVDLHSVLWTPLTDAGGALAALDAALDGVLARTEVDGGPGLSAKLVRIRAHLEAGRANAAQNQLRAFIQQVEAMESDGRLSSADASTLLGLANALAALLSA
jgi:uncharacterized membrane protein